MAKSSISFVSSAVLGLAALGCSDAGEVSLEPVRENSADLFLAPDATSNLRAVVAVYHKNDDSPGSAWYTRPCTGRVLTPSAYPWLVLTARHCVTPADAGGDGLEGAPLSPGSLRIDARLTPGEIPPPDNASATACDVIVPPSPGQGYLGLSETLDMALIAVCSPIPGMPSQPALTPLYLGAAKDLEGYTNLAMFGYGQGGDEALGGTLRTSSAHHFSAFAGPIGTTGRDYYKVRSTNGTTGAYMGHGDSGGPSILFRPGSRWVQVGVHKEGSTGFNWDVVVSRATAEFIQSNLDRLYLRPHVTYTNALTRSGFGNLATVRAEPTSGSYHQWWEYEFSTQRIRAPSVVDGTTCLRRNADFTLVMATCDTNSNQKWWLSADNQIHNNALRCVELQSNNTILLKSCSASSLAQKWYWDADSRVPGVY